MMSIVSEALNTTCPIRMVRFPSPGKAGNTLRACTKKISDATTITISGTTRVRFTGRARSDQGEWINLDGLTGWAEEVHNRW